MAALARIDLGALPGWQVTVDGGPPRAILVPGGGYNSDAQAPPFIDSHAVSDNVTYTLTLTLPVLPDPTSAVWLLEFGAINFGAEVFVGGAAVGAHAGPGSAFAVDVTAAAAAAAGVPLALTVVTRPFAFYGGLVASGFSYPETWSAPADGWSARACAGICSFAAAAAYPALRVAALDVVSHVAAGRLDVNVTLVNAGAAVAAGGRLLGALRLANGSAAPWMYPPFPPTAIPDVAPHGGAVSIALSLPWSPPPEASWWPNRPFREDYTTVLHALALSDGAGAPLATRRFGWVEHGAAAYYWTINGVRVNHLSDATPEAGMSFYDAYSASAAFAAGAGGAAESWRRYMRLGLTSNRIHQSTPTQAMLDAADEVGFLLKPEAHVRGCGGYEPCVPGSPLLAQGVAELVRWSAAHASVFAFSVENESEEAAIGALIDAAARADAAARPLTTEGSGGAAGYNGSATGVHAVNLLHYALPDSMRSHIRAVGECAWCVARGLEAFSALALAGRLDDVAYYSGWDMLNYWPNFLLGYSAARHAWKQPPCNGSDRVDGVDGWGSPVVDWVTRAFHPFLVADVEAVVAQPAFNGSGWPYGPVAHVTAGANVTRELAVFNDVLSSDWTPWAPAAAQLALRWAACWDAPCGGAGGAAPVVNGSLAVDVAPGFNARALLSFVAPAPGAGGPPGGRFLWLLMAAERRSAPGVALYTEDRVAVAVTEAAAEGG